MKISDLLRADAPADADEAAFRVARLRDRNVSLAETSVAAGLIFHPFCIFFEWLTLPVASTYEIAVTIQGLMFCACVLQSQGRIFGRRALPYFVVCVHFLSTVPIAVVVSDCRADACPRQGAETNVVAFSLVASVLLMLMPFSSRRAFAVALLFYVATGWIAAGTLVPPMWLWLAAMSMVIVVFVRYVMTLWAKVEASREFRVRRSIAPLQVVRRWIDDTVPLEALFKPEPRFTVCVSSDWRNYQSLTAELSQDELVRAIDAYYELCQRLLREVAPSGNYHSDWIADELFVVFYREDDGDERALARQAVEFATRLLYAKAAFSFEHRHPRAIDIGLAAGVAVVGMMGPADHKKATALGQVPGRSRRVQTVGKLLRSRHGERDRVIFGEDVRALVGDAITATRFEAEERLRDIDDQTLYYVEADVPETADRPRSHGAA